jgi:hypothetical protein
MSATRKLKKLLPLLSLDGGKGEYTAILPENRECVI